jgi:hypothetical protein
VNESGTDQANAGVSDSLLGMIKFSSPILKQSIHPNKTRALVTIVHDEKTRSEFDIVGSTFECYADRHGLDLIVLTDFENPNEHKCGVKYIYAEVARYYEQILFLDTDIVIDQNAENVFDFVPLTHWGLVHDCPVDPSVHRTYETNWYIDEFPRWLSQSNLPALDLIPWGFNLGVAVAPTNAIDVYRPPTHPVQNSWCAEQWFHTYLLHKSGTPHTVLDRTWNNGWPYSPWEELLPTSRFIHCNGAGAPCHQFRLELLSWLVAGNRLNPPRPPHGSWGGFSDYRE